MGFTEIFQGILLETVVNGTNNTFNALLLDIPQKDHRGICLLFIYVSMYIYHITFHRLEHV